MEIGQEMKEAVACPTSSDKRAVMMKQNVSVTVKTTVFKPSSTSKNISGALSKIDMQIFYSG